MHELLKLMRFSSLHSSADGMMFGALKSCPMCSGHLSFSGGSYKCHGFISEWSKCSYSTTQPERIKGKWKVPEEMDNQYLGKVYYLKFTPNNLWSPLRL